MEKIKQRKISGSFVSGMIGGLAGTLLFFILAFGVGFLLFRSPQTKIDCYLEKEITKKDIKCQITEIQDMGKILLAEDAVSSSTEVIKITPLRDKITTGKFIMLSVEVENMGKEGKVIENLVLFDEQERKYSSLYDFEDWIPEESMGLWTRINPGLEQKVIQIFEVPEQVKDFKLRLMLANRGMFGID